MPIAPSTRAIGTFVLAACLALACACGPAREGDAPRLDLEWSVAPQPPTRGPAVVEVVLADAAGGPLTGAKIHLEANMNHAGMVPQFGESTEAAPGRYAIPVELTMGGDWILTFEVTLPDGSKRVEHADLPGVRGH